jgi:hypothetical protein
LPTRTFLRNGILCFKLTTNILCPDLLTSNYGRIVNIRQKTPFSGVLESIVENGFIESVRLATDIVKTMEYPTFTDSSTTLASK